MRNLIHLHLHLQEGKFQNADGVNSHFDDNV